MEPKSSFIKVTAIPSRQMGLSESDPLLWRHDIQEHATRHNDTQHIQIRQQNDLYQLGIKHNNTQQKGAHKNGTHQNGIQDNNTSALRQSAWYTIVQK